MKIWKTLQKWLALASLLLLLTACPPSPPPTLVEREPIIPESTKVPDKATRDLLSVYNPDTGIMRFTNSTAILDSLKPGDVFVGEPSSAAPYGYLRKVNKISKEGAEVILETTEAKLTDAVHQGTLNATGEIQPSQLRSVTLLSEGAYGRAVEQSEINTQAGVAKGFFFEAGIDAFLEIEAKNEPTGATGTAKARFTGLVKFNVGYRVLVDIGFLADLNWAEAVIGYNEEVSVGLEAEIAGVVKGEKDIARFDFDAITFFIGPVPVVIVPSAKVKIGVKGEASITFSYKFSQVAAFEQGVRWDEDDGWKQIDRNEFNVKHEGPKFKAKGSVSAYTKATMRLLFYNVAGPDLGLTIGAKLEVKYPADPLWRLFGFIEGDIALTVDIFGEELRYNEVLFKIEKEIARGEAEPPVITVLNPNATTGLRVPIDLLKLFSVEDQIGIASRTLRSDRDGELSNLNNVVFTSPGQRIITITATSQTGKSAQASFNLDVINTPPKLSDLVAPTSIGAGVGWAPTSAATAFDPNESQNRLDCSKLTWTTNSGEPITTETSSNKGCQPFIIFAQEGQTQQVTVVASDTEGATDTKVFNVEVTERPENIPPTVKFVLVNDGSKNYQPRDYINRSATLTASVDVYNPDNAPLEYDWVIFGPFEPIGFGKNLGTAATATFVGSESQYDRSNLGDYCSIDGDNNPLTCEARFRVLIKSGGVTLGTREFLFILDYTPPPPR